MDLTPTAVQIMNVFRYYRIATGNYLPVGRLIEQRHLWRDIDDDTFHEALDQLEERGYIAAVSDPPGWQLLQSGADFIRR